MKEGHSDPGEDQDLALPTLLGLDWAENLDLSLTGSGHMDWRKWRVQYHTPDPGTKIREAKKEGIPFIQLLLGA